MERKAKSAVIIIIIVIASISVVGVIFFVQSLNDTFSCVWNTVNPRIGSSASDQIALPLVSSGKYNFTVSWGDGSSDSVTAWNSTNATHTYSSAGTYTVDINGIIDGWSFNFGGDCQKLLKITNWGCLQLGNSGGYFAGCKNLDVTAWDVLNLTGTTTLLNAFCGCGNLTVVPNINEWDVSHVTDMSGMF